MNFVFQALQHGFLNFETFDVNEYEHYEVMMPLFAPSLGNASCSCSLGEPAGDVFTQNYIHCSSSWLHNHVYSIGAQKTF